MFEQLRFYLVELNNGKRYYAPSFRNPEDAFATEVKIAEEFGLTVASFREINKDEIEGRNNA